MSTPLRPDPRSPARKDTATNAQRDVQSIEVPDDGPGTGGAIVTIEQGRARRDGARAKGERGELRQDRADRRERRRSGKADGTAAAEPEDAAEPSKLADGDVANIAPNADPVADAANPVAEVPEGAVAVAEAQHGVLLQPLLDSAASARTVERTRQQLEQAEQAIANAADVVGLVAPLVRHVNTVTEQLNEANLSVGRLLAERDALRHRLAEAEGVPIDAIVVMPLAEPASDAETPSRRLQRIEARQAVTQDEDKKPNPLRPVGIALGFTPQVDSFDGLKRMARRRQLFAAVLMVTVFTGLRIATANGVQFDNLSRNGLADLQYVGSLFQVFLIAWMLYRVVRVGGKGASWLFPDPNGRKRRR